MDSDHIAWRDELSVGDEHIDSQHKTLIGLIGAVFEAPGERDEGLLEDALEYAQVHFAEEEAYWERVGYPDLEQHKRCHKKLVRILLSYKRDYDAGKADLYSFKHFMFRWVRDHIMDEDRRVGLYVSSRRKEQPGGI